MARKRGDQFLVNLMAFVVLTQNGQSVMEIKIGGLFTNASYDVYGKVAFKLAVNYVNSRDDLLPDVILRYVHNETAEEDGPFGLIQSACSLVQDNVGVVIGPATSAGVKAVAPIFTALEIPHIAPFATDPNLSVDVNEYPFLFKVSSPDTFQNQALEDLVKTFGWTKISIIASATDYGRNGIRLFQTNALNNDWTITSVSYFFPQANMTGRFFESMLQEIKQKGTRIILMNCFASEAKIIMEQASELGMTGVGWAWMATDGITGLDGLFNNCAMVPKHLRGLFGTRPAEGKGALYKTYTDLWRNLSYTGELDEGYSMLVFDSVMVAAYGLHSFIEAGHDYHQPLYNGSVCDIGNVASWPSGETLKNHIAKISGDGVSNNLSFTGLQYTTATDYDIVNLRKQGWYQVGSWTQTRPDHLKLDEPIYFHGTTGNVPQDSIVTLSNVTLRVVTILEEPYIMVDKDSTDSQQYVGFCMDLLNQLSQNLGFSYNLEIVTDGQFGGQDPNTGEWNGLVRELLDNRADLIVASMTISYEREQVIDFTKPFQDLGAIILMAKEKSEEKFLAFLDPFSWGLWGAVLAAFVFCGIANTVVSWISPYGQRGRHSGRLRATSKKHKDDRNVFNLWHSMWYSFAQWMMQGAESSPSSFSGRIVYGVWYFVVMVVSATYTANLAAFLTIQRLDGGIASVDDLAKQTSIKYGTVKNSAVQKFFDTQITEPYLTMNKFMRERDTLINSTSYGLELVQNSYGKPKDQQFIFVFDSAPLEYAASKQPCHVDVVGRIFNQFGYGLGLQKGSVYLDAFSLEILKLRQSGYLQSLRNKWVTSGTCKSSAEASSITPTAQQASIGNMAGVFCFMLIGLGLVIPVILCEFCVAAHRDRKAMRKTGKKINSLSFKEALARRCDAICSDTRRRFHVCVGCHNSSSDESDAEPPKTDVTYGNHPAFLPEEQGWVSNNGSKNGFTNFSFEKKGEGSATQDQSTSVNDESRHNGVSQPSAVDMSLF